MAAGNESAKRPTRPDLFFSAEEQSKIQSAIDAAENGTAGEIVVRLERKCPGDPVEHSRKLLESLGVTGTEERTGVLIYISLEDHKVAVYGDEVIHRKIGSEGWNHICGHLTEHFRAGNFTEGLCEAISHVGEVLHQHFPAREVNPDELPNKPSFGE